MPTLARVASAPLACFVILTTVVATSAHAQRRRAADTSATPPTTSITVRAELAAVLLQSKKYDDAAREYRALLARDQTNVGYRLGLARALAWGDRPREAEIELLALRTKRVYGPTVDTLLREVREALEPRAAEAAKWVAERRDYAPYRLAYARALAREHYNWAASTQYDTLLAGGGQGKIPDAATLRLEQSRALIDVGDFTGGAARMREVLRAAPNDTALRHELANVLLSAHRDAEARAQYDTLILRTPTAELFVERARLRLANGDSSGAEYDLLASLKQRPGASSYVMLGDLYRERGDYVSAQGKYRDAIGMPGRGVDRMGLRSTIAQLARELRPVAAFVPAVGDDPGLRMTTEGVSDNLGVHYVSSTVGGAVALGDATRVGLSVVHQYLAEHSAVRSIDLNTYGGDASLSSQIDYGSFLGRFAISGGQVRPPASRAITVGDAVVAGWLNAWELALETSMGPAYPSLLTTTALRPADGVDDVLTERAMSGTLGGPVGPLDVAVTAQRSRLSDANRRVTLQGYARYPLAPAVFVVYTASRITFDERSLRYWDPLDYVAHSAGVEVASRPLRGLSWAVRALPGVAWSRELPQPKILNGRLQPRPTEVVNRTAVQVSSSAELSWRGPGWEGMSAVSYGLGRVGEYQRLSVTLGARIIP